tara:strand:+ start:184 stop:1194 length:1011 start_codon:yes stop_codon:yes gene_type:complete
MANQMTQEQMMAYIAKLEAENQALQKNQKKKPGRKAGKRKPKPKKEKCYARIEGSYEHWGTGTGRCINVATVPLEKGGPPKLCPVCFFKKCEAEYFWDSPDGTQPCQTSHPDNECIADPGFAKRKSEGYGPYEIGLFYGMIDQPLQVVDSKNIIRNWWINNDEVRAQVKEKVASGEWQFAYGDERGNRGKANEEVAADGDYYSTMMINGVKETVSRHITGLYGNNAKERAMDGAKRMDKVPLGVPSKYMNARRYYKTQWPGFMKFVKEQAQEIGYDMDYVSKTKRDKSMAPTSSEQPLTEQEKVDLHNMLSVDGPMKKPKKKFVKIQKKKKASSTQ